jgi:putative membrane protein
MERVMRQVIAGVLVIGLGAWATAEEKKDKESPLDTKDFVLKVGYINLGEINAARLASQRASRADVKQFAQHLARDHQKANQEMLQLAVKNNWVLAGAIDAKYQALGEKLSRLQGPEFDKEFIQAMVKGHKEAIKLYEAQAKGARDPDAKAYAEKVLPRLREHLKEAEKLAAEEGKGNR